MGDQRLFISHASEDAAVVNRMVAYLEANGVACWISSRDIPAQSIYAEEIAHGIKECTACAVVVSSASNASKAVKRELELASHYDKPFIPVRVDSAEPGPGLDYYLRNAQWIDYRREGERALDRIAGVRSAPAAAATAAPSPPFQETAPDAPRPNGSANGAVILTGVVAAVVSVALIGAIFGNRQQSAAIDEPMEASASVTSPVVEVAPATDSARVDAPTTQAAPPPVVDASTASRTAATPVQPNPLSTPITSVAGTTWLFDDQRMITFRANGTFVTSWCHAGVWRQVGPDITVTFGDVTPTGRLENNRLEFSFVGPRDSARIVSYNDMGCIEELDLNRAVR